MRASYRIRNRSQTVLGMICPVTIYGMKDGSLTPHEILWKNVLALMHKVYKRENLTRLARETGIGNATASRIKARKTAVRIDSLVKVAAKFDVEPWQLLSPNFNPTDIRRPAAVEILGPLFAELGLYWDKLPFHMQRALLEVVRLAASMDTGRRGLNGDGDHPRRRASDEQLPRGPFADNKGRTQ